MRRSIRALSVLSLALVAVARPAIAADGSVEDFEAAQVAAWNAHDAAAYTAAFADDAQVVSALGWRWRGRAEAASNIADGFKYVFAGARMNVGDIAARPVAADVVAVTLAWTIDGARTLARGPEGDRAAGHQHGFTTQVLRRTAAGWTIVAQQDTETLAAQPPVTSSAEPAAPPPTAYPTTPPPVRRCILARANGDCLIYGKAKSPKP